MRAGQTSASHEGAAAPSPAPDSGVLAGKARPRGPFPHFRRADDSIAGAERARAGAAQLDIRSQPRSVIENIRDILAAAGASLADVVEISTFLVSMDDFQGYNEVYGEFFGYQGPARTTVAVAALPHPHLLIEIKAVAWRPRSAGPAPGGKQP